MRRQKIGGPLIFGAGRIGGSVTPAKVAGGRSPPRTCRLKPSSDNQNAFGKDPIAGGPDHVVHLVLPERVLVHHEGEDANRPRIILIRSADRVAALRREFEIQQPFEKREGIARITGQLVINARERRGARRDDLVDAEPELMKKIIDEEERCSPLSRAWTYRRAHC